MTKNREEVSFTVSGEDLISRVFREIGKNAQQMEMVVKRAGDRMDHALDGATVEAKKLTGEMKGVGREADAAARKIERLKSAARGLDQTITRYNAAMAGVNQWAGNALMATGTTLALTTAAVAGTSIRKDISFQRQNAYTSTAIRSNYENEARYRSDSSRLRDQALTLGKDPHNFFSSLEISQAQEALAKAGYADQKGVGGLLKAIPDFLDFAQYHRIDPSQASEFGADMVEMFKYDKNQAGTLLDMLTKTADISTLDISHIRESMTYAGSVGAIQGRDPEEILGTLATVAYALKGSVSGTGVAAVYSDLLNLKISDQAAKSAPSKKVSNIAEGLQKSLVKNGQALPFEEQVKILEKEFSKLNQQEQDWLAKTISGEEHQKTLLALIGQGYETLAKNIATVRDNSKGINHDLVENLLLTSAGDLNNLTKLIEELQMEIGDGLSPLFGELSKQIRSVAQGGKVDFEGLRDSIDQSYKKLIEHNEGLAEMAKLILETGVDIGEVGVAVSPLAGGIAGGVVDILNGDIIGALSSFSQGLENANENIDQLPSDLQELGTAVRNLTLLISTIALLNLGGKAWGVGKKGFELGKKGFELGKKGFEFGKTAWQSPFTKSLIDNPLTKVLRNPTVGTAIGFTAIATAVGGAIAETYQKGQAREAFNNQQPGSKVIPTKDGNLISIDGNRWSSGDPLIKGQTYLTEPGKENASFLENAFKKALTPLSNPTVSLRQDPTNVSVKVQVIGNKAQVVEQTITPGKLFSDNVSGENLDRFLQVKARRYGLEP